MVPMYEIVRRVISGKAEAVALHFGLSASAVYKWGESPEGGGVPIPGNRIIPLCQFLEDYGIVEYLANNLGLIVFRIPAGKPTNKNYDRIARLSKEFGEGIQAVGQALEDGRISKSEIAKIDKEFMEFITEAKSFLEHLRRQVKRKGEF